MNDPKSLEQKRLLQRKARNLPSDLCTLTQPTGDWDEIAVETRSDLH